MRYNTDDIQRQCDQILQLLEQHGELCKHDIIARTGLTVKQYNYRMSQLNASSQVHYQYIGQGSSRKPLVVWKLGPRTSPPPKPRRKPILERWQSANNFGERMMVILGVA